MAGTMVETQRLTGSARVGSAGLIVNDLERWIEWRDDNRFAIIRDVLGSNLYTRTSRSPSNGVVPATGFSPGITA